MSFMRLVSLQYNLNNIKGPTLTMLYIFLIKNDKWCSLTQMTHTELQ